MNQNPEYAADERTVEEAIEELRAVVEKFVAESKRCAAVLRGWP